MPDNNMAIMVGLGLAGLWFMNRQRGSQEDQVGQLTGAAMQSSGEGTWPASPGGGLGQLYSFMPGTNVPLGASSGEDIGIYPGGVNRPELEFKVEKSIPPAGTSDDSPTTPEFAGTAPLSVTASTIWDQEALIASANFMPLLAIQDTGGGGVNILGSNVDISNLSSKEYFRAVNLDTGFAFTTTGSVLGEYVRGFTGTRADPPTSGVVVSQTAPTAAWIERQEWDLDIGI